MRVSRQTLPHELSGERREIDDPLAGIISYYVDGPAPEKTPSGFSRAPLLLVHSINAAASAHEVKPLFDAFKKNRRTYALDLPGFGHSERSERTYDQDLMVDAIQSVVSEIRTENGFAAIDALAVSLACEFLAKVALARPDSIRSIALVSPTGFARNTPTSGPPEANTGRLGAYRLLSMPFLGRPLFKLLTSPTSIRFFLQRTWGSKQIDEGFIQAARRVSHCGGAHRAPLYFIAGYLFSADIRTVYKALSHPVWLSHGVRGLFNDFSRIDSVTAEPNWRFTTFQTGAMPHFEVPGAFIEAYEHFLGGVGGGDAADSAATGAPHE